MKTERIAVLGGGASGTLLAAELLRQARRPLEVVLLEPRPALGRGPAYTTPFPVHVMNVPAGRLSARRDDPLDFVRWLRRDEPALDERSFVERRRYGRYLEEVLAEAQAAARPRARLEHLQEEAIDLQLLADGVEIVLPCAPPFRAERAVLALGNLPPDALARIAPEGLDPIRYVRDPWATGALDFAEPHGDVLVLGTGLTAVDVVLGLRHRGHEGRVLAVSRRGLLPHVHAFPAVGGVPAAPAWDLPAGTSLRRLTAEVREQVHRTRATGGDFRAVVDSLRPLTQRLWRSLAPAERARFMRHVQPFWDIHRHRMAPEVARAVDALRGTGVLRIVAGSVEALEDRSGLVRARVRLRGDTRSGTLDVRHVIDCTGPAAVARTQHPLLRRLLARGTAQADALGLGLDAASDGRVISLGNPRGDRLFAMGPLLRGTLWETTAMAEIRAQAADLAATLVAMGGARGPARAPVRSARLSG